MIINLGRITLVVKVWPMLLFTLCCFILVSLGFWQLARGNEKQNREFQLSENDDSRIITFNHTDWNDSDWQALRDKKVLLVGKIKASPVWYVENKVLQHQLGVDCIVVFELKDKAGSTVNILLNLGWSAVDEQRFPVLIHQTDDNLVELPVRVALPTDNWFMSSDIIQRDSFNFIQQIDPAVLGEKAQTEFLPIIAIAENQSLAGFQPHWQPMAMPAQKHFAYAVQWFGLAIALGIIFFIKASKWKK